MRRMLPWVLSIAFLGQVSYLQARGKVDVGPLYLNVKILESGATVEELDMWGARADATVQVIHGLCLRPMVQWASGDGDFAAGSLGAGYYLPICDALTIMPVAGISYSRLNSVIDKPLLGLSDIDEKFRTWTPYIGIEAVVYITPKLSLSGVYQYGWARTRTTWDSPVFGRVLSTIQHGRGPIYALVLDYKLTDHWSVNLSSGYNLSQSKEKHGFKGWGLRAGLGYCW